MEVSQSIKFAKPDAYKNINSSEYGKTIIAPIPQPVKK
jgi:hypothetical protein